jgi:hypothetical protein
MPLFSFLIFFIAITSVIVLAVIVFPLTYSDSGISGGAKKLITSVGIFLAIMATMCSLYGWKVVKLLQGYDYDIFLHLSKKKKGTVSSVKIEQSTRQTDGEFKSTRVSIQKGAAGDPPLTTDINVKKYGVSNTNPFEAAMTKNLLNRREICKEQIIHWNKTLRNTEAQMLMQDDNSSMSRDITPSEIRGQVKSSTYA